MADDAVAELTFFAHAGRPLRDSEIPGLNNQFLCWAHDDPWYLSIYYRWHAIESPLRRLLPTLLDSSLANQTVDVLRTEDTPFCCTTAGASKCEGTDDIDALQQKFNWGGEM